MKLDREMEMLSTRSLSSTTAATSHLPGSSDAEEESAEVPSTSTMAGGGRWWRRCSEPATAQIQTGGS